MDEYDKFMSKCDIVAEIRRQRDHLNLRELQLQICKSTDLRLSEFSYDRLSN
jgi:hypothetical protein